MGRYLLLAILASGLGVCTGAVRASTPSAPAPMAATATHPMVATPAKPAATATAPAKAAPSSTPSASTQAAAIPAGENSGPSLPTRGMSMANVEHIFGAPQEKLPEVPNPGTKLHPPITRWIYPNYVVYFEYNYVVHTVLKKHPFENNGSSGI